MPANLPDDPVLSRVRSALHALYGTGIHRVVLYGARGDARPDSDYDIAVFLTSLPDRWAELDRLADLGTDILGESGKLVHAMPYPADAWAQRTPLMHEIRKDGIDLRLRRPPASLRRRASSY